jgi:hypothetical protein
MAAMPRSSNSHQFSASAQLVAHAGQELRLALARLRQLPALVLDFIEQPTFSMAITA